MPSSVPVAPNSRRATVGAVQAIGRARRKRHEQQHRNHGVLGLLHKHQLPCGHVDANEVAELHLSGGDEVRQREHDMTFDRALQVARAVTEVGSFLQQIAASLPRYS